MNWDKFNDVANSLEAKGQPKPLSEKKKSMWMKFGEPGNYIVRIVPEGNEEEQTFFKESIMHNLGLGDKGWPIKFLCWNFIQDNVVTVAQPLANEGLLKGEDYNRFQKHGCPGCEAFKFMVSNNVDKETRGKLYPKVSYYFNILNRHDDQIHVWGTSEKIAKQILGHIKTYKDVGQNIIHPDNGFDFKVVAQGVGNNRRYEVYVIPQQAPLDAKGETAYNLNKPVSLDFKSYQESINVLKAAWGKFLLSIGYHIPGDEASEVFDPPQAARPFHTPPADDTIPF